jgi:glycine betaine catabolism B
MTLIQDRSPSAASSGGIDERVVCTRVEQVTPDVRSFTLARPGGAALAFDPGQHLTVTVDVGGTPTQRCYTIASSPTRPEELTITVKRVPGGPVSSWLHDRLTVGDSLHVAGPFGWFSTARHPSSAYLFLSAGSGITPLMSMTRALYDGGGPADVVFVHSARTPEDIIFRRELDEIGTRSGFSVAAVCEADSPREAWRGPTGRLTLRTLLQQAPDLHDREVFTCGPPGYMAAVRELLELAGVDPARSHEESFELGGTAPSPVTEPAGPAQTRAVEFRRSGRTLECGPGESILAAALRAGLRPPSMCGEGVCGTCKTDLLAGDVDMRHAGGIRQREIDCGRILLCCSVPLGDVVVDA